MPASANARTSIPPYFGNDQEWKRQFANWVYAANKGQIPNTGTVTLNTNSFFTTVTDHRISSQSFVEFMPQTATAADEKASGSMYVSGMANGALTITHASRSDADRTFTYTIWG